MKIIVILRVYVYSPRSPMSLNLTPAFPVRWKKAFDAIFTLKGIWHILRLTFLTGPWLLVSSRISPKSASMMMMLCAPAMVLYGMLTLPTLLFPSPDQQAYFYFGRMLNEDPARWVIFGLAALCTVVALAVPASEEKPLQVSRY